MTKPKRPLVADRRVPAQSPQKPPARRKKPKRVRAKRPKSFLRRLVSAVISALFGFAWRVGLVLGLLISLGIGMYYASLPEIGALLDGRARGSVTLLDRYGEPFAWRGDQFAGVVTAQTVSPALKNAIIATEDKRFYWHPGIDPRGIASAVRINLREGRGPLSGHGGSTLTQQTAKLLCLGRAYDPKDWSSEAAYEADCRQGSLWRKIKEACYSFALELRYTKDEILTIYLNRAFLGAGARGVEAAAQRYFGKSARQVNAPEAAMIAGLLVAPSRYAPTNNLERAQNRAGVVIKLMAEQGYLSDTEFALARAQPATLSQAASAKAGGYFADWVMSSGPEFFTRNTTEDVIIRSTLDPAIQKAAERAVAEVFREKVKTGSKAQAAVIVMSSDGAVRAMVGGRRTQVSGAFNRAVQAKRQTGSAFKPFVYATALDLGYSPNDVILDAPLTLKIPGSGPWSPQNYSRKFYGNVTLTESLARSINIPAVKISETVGRENVQKVAQDFGILGDLAPGPAIALGTSEASLLEMTGAYAGILNGGSAVTPFGLIELRLLGEAETLMGSAGGIGERVIQRGAAEQLVYMLHQVVEQGTGKRAKLSDRPVAGKTGTSQKSRDAWFIGFSADYVAGVWMGYDDNTPMSGVTGSGLPADIWRETMQAIHQNLPARPLPERIPEPRQTAPKTPSSVQDNISKSPKNAVERLLMSIFGGGN